VQAFKAAGMLIINNYIMNWCGRKYHYSYL